MALSAEQRFDLIRENLGEILNPELIESILKEGRNPRVYWGNDYLS
jgi:tyrosyl-tRNA synthetase